MSPIRLPSPPSKYNVDTSEVGKLRRTYAGRLYASEAEARYAQELDRRQKAGDILSWEPQVKIPVRVEGVRITDYVADFKVIHLDGSREVIEIKGHRTAEWRIKERLIRALYPDMVLTVVNAKDYGRER